MPRYADIQVYPNSGNPDDGMRIDYWDTERGSGTTFAGFVEFQVTPEVTDISDIHGNEIGRIAYPAGEEDYLQQLAALIDAFTD